MSESLAENKQREAPFSLSASMNPETMSAFFMK